MDHLRCYSETIAERLLSRLQLQPSGCLEWQGYRLPSGYGRIGRGPAASGNTLTHRVMWELFVGPIEDGLFVLHHCDNPPCCRLSHLFLGTIADNSRDMMEKGRGRGQIPAGVAHPDARLSDEAISRMRELAPHVGNYAELGRRFGVSKQHARAVVLGSKRSAA